MRDVSRETSDWIDTYVGLIKKWNPRIQIIAQGEIELFVERHIADSLQIADLIPADPVVYLDIGSGGGLPAIPVLADRTVRNIADSATLIESDGRKAAFLRTVLRTLGISADVRAERIEQSEPVGADVITARALADLTTLLDLAAPHLRSDGVLLAMKGRRFEEEVRAAKDVWDFDLDAIPSRTAADARILRITNIAKKGPQ